MGKHLVYIAGAFAIIVIICSITTSTSGNKTVSQKKVVTNQISDVQINNNNSVTTNFWDYLRSQEKDTIGASNQKNSSQDEPKLTIVLK